MSNESRSAIGIVDSINSSGTRLIDVDSRAFQEGDQIFVDSSNSFYVIRIDSSITIDNDQYVTAKNLLHGIWVKTTDIDNTQYLPITGTALINSNQTIQPFTDGVSQYTQTIPLTAVRDKILGVTSAIDGLVVYIVREDLAAYNMTITDGGVGSSVLFTFPASATKKIIAGFKCDGANWEFIGFSYAQVG